MVADNLDSLEKAKFGLFKLLLLKKIYKKKETEA